MPKVNQLTVLCTNRPGTLAHIATVMGDAGVNTSDSFSQHLAPKAALSWLWTTRRRPKRP